MKCNFVTPAMNRSTGSSSVARSMLAGILIACIGINTAFAASLAPRVVQPDVMSMPVQIELPGTEDSTTALLGRSIESLDDGAIAELEGIYADAGTRATGDTSTARDLQKSWKTVLAKAILKSSAFKAALKAFSERAYVWYMGHINPVVNAMDAVTSWEVQGIAYALGAAGIPASWAIPIAKVLSFFL